MEVEGEEFEDEPDTRTTILVVFDHTSVREIGLPDKKWYVYGKHTADVIKTWVQRNIWGAHGVWIERLQMWLNLVSPDGHHFIRKVDRTEELWELLQQTSQPVLQVERCRQEPDLGSQHKHRRLNPATDTVFMFADGYRL